MFTPDFPGPTLFDGNATARVFVDEGADEAQQRELEAIFQGRKGGPMENLAPLVATWLPTKKASIGIEEEGETITVSVAGAGEMRSQLLRDPQGNAFTLRGGGFVSGLGLEEATLCRRAPAGPTRKCPSASKRSPARGGLHLERLSSPSLIDGFLERHTPQTEQTGRLCPHLRRRRDQGSPDCSARPSKTILEYRHAAG